MSDNDLIRREYIGPRLAIAGFGGKALQDAIAELPAVTVRYTQDDIGKAREAALREALKRVAELMVHKPESATDKDYNIGVGAATLGILDLIQKGADK